MKLEEILACPKCLNPLRAKGCGFQCDFCERYFPSDINGIPCLLWNPSPKREYYFEIDRYNRIAKALPKDYEGLDESQPLVRAKMVKEIIGDIDTYLNIGPGFGQLEESVPEKTKVCLDQSIEFLRILQKRKIPNIFFVNAFAERLPFKTEAFPCVVSDSVFTVAVDQSEYLLENCRVLKKGGKLILATNYRWNYPRKPQSFPVDDPGLLLHFLDEIGVEAEAKYYRLTKTHALHASDSVIGDYLLITGTKHR
ncbi:hypothetical protein ES702_00375 [subsurface metagenome]